MSRNRTARAAAFVALAGLLGVAGFVPVPAAQAATVPTGPGACDTCVKCDGTESYVLATGNSTLTVVDTTAHTVRSVIPLGLPPNTCVDIDWHAPSSRVLVGCTNGMVLAADPVTGQVVVAVNQPGANWSQICADTWMPGVLGWGVNATTGWLCQFAGGMAIPRAALPLTAATELVEKRRVAGAPAPLDSRLFVLGSVPAGARVVGFDRSTFTLMPPGTLQIPGAVPRGLDTSTGTFGYATVDVAGAGSLWQVSLSPTLFVQPALGTWAAPAPDVAVAGSFVFALVQVPGGVGATLEVYDAGSPGSVLYAGSLPASLVANPFGGLTAFPGSGGSIDDVYAIHADATRRRPSWGAWSPT